MSRVEELAARVEQQQEQIETLQQIVEQQREQAGWYDTPDLSRRGVLAAAAALGVPATLGRASAQSGSDPGAACEHLGDHDWSGYGGYNASGLTFIDGADMETIQQGTHGIKADANGNLVKINPDGTTDPLGSSASAWSDSGTDNSLGGDIYALPQASDGIDVGTAVTDQLRTGQYAHNNLPSSPPDSTLYFDTDRGVPTWFDADHYEYPTFVDDVLLTPQTVSGTTASVDVWDPSINSDSLIQGRIYQIDLMGKYSTANTSSKFTVDIDIEGNDAASVSNVGGNASEAPWSLELTFSVRSDGASGEIAAHTRGLFNSESADDHTILTVDTTTAVGLSINIQWNDGSASNSATLGQAHLKQMG